MSDYIKALNIHAYLEKVSREPLTITVDDILAASSSKDLDYFYRWCCQSVR